MATARKTRATHRNSSVAVAAPVDALSAYALNWPSDAVEASRIMLADAFEWLAALPENSLHAIVTEPPYGVKEYEAGQLEKRAKGSGVWRIPPAFDGHTRSPLPRFTALNAGEREELRDYFTQWAKLAARVMRPGGHVIIASNTFLSPLVFGRWSRVVWSFAGS